MQFFYNPSSEYFLPQCELPLFHQIQFHKVNYKIPEHQFLFEGNGDQNLLFFHAEEESLVSTARSSFGGFAKNSPLQMEMLLQARTYLPKSKKLKIVNPPLCYGFLNESLLSAATQIHQEINQSIPLTDWDERVLSDNRRKVLKKSFNAGFVFKEVGIEQLEQVYTIIYLNRKRKGFPTTMSFTQLENVVKNFPDYYRLFIVHNSMGEMLSSAVVLKINAEISYLFYLGAGPQELSGNTFLVFQLIEMLKKEGVKLFDLGVSSVDGEVNKGLFRFKEGFGSTVSDKLTLIY